MDNLTERRMPVRFTEKERELIEKLLKEGNSIHSIARFIKRPPSSLYNEVSSGGGREVYNSEERKKTNSLAFIKFDKSELDIFTNHPNQTFGKTRYFTLEERKFVEMAIKKGATIAVIAMHLKRTHSSIGAEITRGGGRINYDAEKRSEQIKKNLLRRGKVSPNEYDADNFADFSDLENRIQVLEMQLEIILDIIKEKK